MSTTVTIQNEQDMQDLVAGLLSNLGGATVLALNGDLGTGKTTFTKALAKELGITEHITSPTFVIQKSYKIPTQSPEISTARSNLAVEKLVHIDAYRLEGADDMEVLNFSTTLAQEGTLIVIEWADNIKEALPEGTLRIDFKYIDEKTREVTVDA